MKHMSFLAGLVIALGLVIPVAHAAEFVAPTKDDNGIVTIDSGEHKNLYLAGSTISVTTPVSGDLFVAGGKVTIKGNVEQDIAVAGGTIVVDGNVGGDIRIAGGDITINGTVGGDVLAGGGTVTIADSAKISGDLIVGSGQTLVSGPVTGKVRIAGGDTTINSAITGEVWVHGSKSLTFGSKAVVQTVHYEGPKQAVVKDGAKVTNIDFNERVPRRGMHKLGSLLGLAFAIKLIAWIIAALALMWLLPRRAHRVVEGVGMNWGLNFLIGLVGLIVIPIIAGLLLFTIVGYYVAFILFVWYALAFLVSGAATALLVGAWVDKWLLKRPTLVLDWQAAVIGAVVLALVNLIPIVGFIVTAVLCLMTFGSLLRYAKEQIKNERAVAVTPEV